MRSDGFSPEGNAAALRARERIKAWPGLLASIQEAAGDSAHALTELVCWGEYLFLVDPRFSQAKAEREESARRIANAARELAAALRETTWPGLGWHEVQRPQDDRPGRLHDYLDRLADWTDGMIEGGPDFRGNYPPGLSRTSHRSFMLRHIKYAIRGHLNADHSQLAAEIATAVLGEDVTEDDIKKV